MCEPVQLFEEALHNTFFDRAREEFWRAHRGGWTDRKKTGIGQSEEQDSGQYRWRQAQVQEKTSFFCLNLFGYICFIRQIFRRKNPFPNM